MRNRKNPGLWTFATGALAAGALLIGLPGRAAVAAPATADEAQAMALECSARAAQHRDGAGGGAAFKAGLIQRNEACAARYGALADQLAGTAAAPVASPEADHYNALAAHYRFIGGAAFKAGLVQGAEAQARRAEAATATAAGTPPVEPSPVCLAVKPVVQLECRPS
jgi:hypothetical protein